jgi:hypothetical protein
VTPPPRTDDAELEMLARLMDNQFRIPAVGWRFGLNTLIDLIPGVGDTATSLIAFGIMTAAVRRGLPRTALLRMALNIAIYSIGGILPIIGDIFDTWWKPNMRNMEILRRHAHETREATASDRLFIAAIGALLLVLVMSSAAVFWYLLHLLFRH